MYCYGYNQQRDARHLLNTLDLARNPFGECGDCLIKRKKIPDYHFIEIGVQAYTSEEILNMS